MAKTYVQLRPRVSASGTTPLPTGAAPDVLQFRAGTWDSDTQAFIDGPHWDDLRENQIIDWACLQPPDTTNFAGVTLFIKTAGGVYVSTGNPDLGFAEDGSFYSSVSVGGKDLPVTPEQWTLIAVSANKRGELNKDIDGNPTGPEIVITTLDPTGKPITDDGKLDGTQFDWGTVDQEILDVVNGKFSIKAYDLSKFLPNTVNGDEFGIDADGKFTMNGIDLSKAIVGKFNGTEFKIEGGIFTVNGVDLSKTIAESLNSTEMQVVNGQLGIKGIDLGKALGSSYSSTEFRIFGGQLQVAGVDLAKAIATSVTAELGVSGGKFGVNSLAATKITAGTLAANVILSSSIAATQILAGTLGAGVIYAGSVSAANITAGNLAAGVILTSSISATQITTGTLGAGVIYAGTIACTQIAAGTLGASVILSSKINADQINAGTLAAGVIYAGSIAASQISAGTISAAVSITSPNITSINGHTKITLNAGIVRAEDTDYGYVAELSWGAINVYRNSDLQAIAITNQWVVGNAASGYNEFILAANGSGLILNDDGVFKAQFSKTELNLKVPLRMDGHTVSTASGLGGRYFNQASRPTLDDGEFAHWYDTSAGQMKHIFRKDNNYFGVVMPQI